MKMLYTLLLTLWVCLVSSFNTLAEEPMVIKLRPVIFGLTYTEDDSFYETFLEINGVAFSFDSHIELKMSNIVYEPWYGYDDVSSSEIQKLLNREVIKSHMDFWASDAIPVIFVDSVNGVYIDGTDCEVYGGNGAIVVCLGTEFDISWLSKISIGIGQALGLTNSSVVDNLMNPDSVFPELYVNGDQTKIMRQEALRRKIAMIPRIRPEWIIDSVTKKRRLVFWPENLVDGVQYRWNFSRDLKGWQTLDPTWWNPSSGGYLGASSMNARAFYSISIIPVYEQYF